jgi:thioredoxin-like negative regulator of GroEL
MGCSFLREHLSERSTGIWRGFELSLIDIEQEPQIAKAYGVQAIPVLIVLEPGGKLRKKIGFRNTADLKAWLQTTN